MAKVSKGFAFTIIRKWLVSAEVRASVFKQSVKGLGTRTFLKNSVLPKCYIHTAALLWELALQKNICPDTCARSSLAESTEKRSSTKHITQYLGGQ